MAEADRLLGELAGARGFPEGDRYEEQVSALSVHHGHHVHGYRRVHRAALARTGGGQNGGVDTEQMREAMLEARDLFDDLLTPTRQDTSPGRVRDTDDVSEPPAARPERTKRFGMTKDVRRTESAQTPESAETAERTGTAERGEHREHREHRDLHPRHSLPPALVLHQASGEGELKKVSVMKPDQDPERTPSREEAVVKGRVTPVPAERSPDDRESGNRQETEEVSRREALKGQVDPESAETDQRDRTRNSDPSRNSDPARNGDGAAARPSGPTGTGTKARGTTGVEVGEREARSGDRTGRTGAGDGPRASDGPGPRPVPRGAGGALPQGGSADTKGRTGTGRRGHGHGHGRSCRA